MVYQISSDRIQQKIYRGMGKEAAKIGRPFDIFRDGSLIYPQQYAYIHRSTNRNFLEAAVGLRDIIFVDIVTDAYYLQLGDVFIGLTPNERFVLASKTTLQPVIGYRCEVPINIRRPSIQSPNNSNIAPYGGRLENQDQILTFNASTGQYAFVSSGSEYQVYAQKIRGRSQGPLPEKLPQDVKTSEWIFCLELYPGITLLQDDYILYDGLMYQIQSIDIQIAGMSSQVVFTQLMSA